MTLCDWIVLLELVAIAVAGVRIWQLGRDRNRALEEPALAEWCIDAMVWAKQSAEAKIASQRDTARGWLARTVRIARQLRAERDALSAELDAAHLAVAAVRLERDRLATSSAELRDARCALALQIRAMRRATRHLEADRDAHADRALQLARRVTELETEIEACRARLREAGTRINDLLADNAAALGIQSGGER